MPLDCETGLQELRELLAACPGMAPRFAKWHGESVIVPEGEYKRLRREAIAQGRLFAGQGDYLGYWFVWLGTIPKAKRERCGARTRKGTPCQCQPVEGRKRCKLHGGGSTGPKTEEGRARIAESNRARMKAKRAAFLATTDKRGYDFETQNGNVASSTGL